MHIGIPKEIKQSEYRVALTPAHAEVLIGDGHTVHVESRAGEASGFPDRSYTDAGARIAESHQGLYRASELVVKGKEPIGQEYSCIRPDHVIFGYFHFAASRELTNAMIERRCACVASETIAKDDGTLPALRPMSEVAGRMAVQEGAKCLERPGGGFGVLLGGIPGVAPAEVVVLGGGTAGANAARTAAGLGARVTILEINEDRLRSLAEIMPANVTVLSSNPRAVREKVKMADLVIGAVLVAGARAPVLVARALLKEMKPGSVIVDIAVDQGGCVETTRPTTHDSPTYVVDGVIHYGVANMPGAVPRTSTLGYANAVVPYVRTIAAKGLARCVREEPEILRGLNMVDGRVTCRGVAEAFGLPDPEPETAVASWPRLAEKAKPAKPAKTAKTAKKAKPAKTAKTARPSGKKKARKSRGRRR